MALIYGHRGASAYAPENTLEAFRLAMEMGADGVELDVHLSKDGELMVIHDGTLSRTTNGSGAVKDFTRRELQLLDACNGMEKYRGVTIPTLGEVYALLRDSNMLINVEIKTDDAPYEGIEEKCLALEKEMGMESRIIYSSFNHYTIAKLHSLAPDAKLGILYGCALYEPWNYAKQLGAAYIHPFYPSLYIPELGQDCLENGIGINTWTVDDPKIMALCLEMKANIITNKPDIAIALRNASQV